MELTLDQALQKGIEAHRAGNVQEADRYYTAVLKANPKYPDANHNMGVLAVGVGKVEEALPFFKTALEANPNIAQFWLSYIDALIKLDRRADAKAVCDQAKSNGAKGDAFDQLEKHLSEVDLIINVQDPPQDQQQPIINLYTQGQLEQALAKVSQLFRQFPNSIFLYNIEGAANRGLGQLDAAIVSYGKALQLNPDYAEAHNNMGNALQDQGKILEALEAFNKAIAAKPDYAEAYNNMGIALREQGKLDEAIEAYKKALSIRPDYAEAYNNMGNALQDQGKILEPLEAFNKALAVKPDYAEAYNNMGIALREQGKLDEAIEAFSKALSIKPNHANAYNNMGVALIEQGKLEEAVKAYNQALAITPDDSKAWKNLSLALQAIKLQISSKEELVIYYPKDTGSQYYKIAKSILDFRLDRGRGSANSSLSETLELIANNENLSITNPSGPKTDSVIKPISADKVIALTHFGRSGTGLLHSLIDGHPEVSTLPSIYLSEYFDHSTWEQITAGGWQEVADRFVSIYQVLFDATSTVPIGTKSKQLIYNIGKKEGMANVGENRNEVLRVDKKLFCDELNRLMDFYDEVDAFVLFKLAHTAFHKAINDLRQKSLIFYHIHNPDTYAQLNFVRSAPNANWVVMVREPIQSCESWIRANSTFDNNDHSGISKQIISMLFGIDNIIYHRQNSIGVRLEDLKDNPRKTIPALCKWMGIKESETLYEMTAQGKKWWGDPISPDFAKDGMDPFGKTSINRKVGSIFSERDQYILRTLFYPFNVRFGYVEENVEWFKVDLQAIRSMLEKMFDFEKIIIEKTQADPEKFMKSGSYLYLRSGLIERWSTLNKYQTYPNMIKRLSI